MCAVRTGPGGEALPKRIGNQRAKGQHLSEVAASRGKASLEGHQIHRAAELQHVGPHVASCTYTNKREEAFSGDRGQEGEDGTGTH